MWNGNLVIDAVAHAYDFVESNRVEDCSPEEYAGLIQFVYDLGHGPLESREPGFLLNNAEWSAGWTPEELASVYFEESDVDIMVYHGVEIAAYFKRGSSPWQIGVELKKLYPDRVLLYAPVDPLKGLGELETMERLVEEAPINGFKFYPSNGMIDHDRNRAMTTMYDDPEKAFPFFEKGRELGVNVMAIHKAWPVGPGPLDKDKVDDVNSAAVAFPDLIFEVVHSGWAFLEDCGIQLMTHPNIWANLEAVANFAVRQPRRFAHVIGTLMRYGGDDRIMWGTGCPLGHPQPLVEAFANFQMPQDLQDGYGYTDLSDETKAKIFGGNMVRLHNLDVDAIKSSIADDDWAKRRKAYTAAPTGPWRELRERVEAGCGGVSDALIERVRAAVNEVPDPCSVAQGVPVGLVDMGLLCGIEVGAERDGCHDVQVELRLTGPGCFYGIHFEREIRQRLEAMPDVATIDVEFSREFDWTQDDIAPHVQRELRERRERLLAQLPVERRLPVAR